MSEQTEVEIQLPVLGRGSGESATVRRAQHMLNDRGFGPLVEDGAFGPKTEASVKRFQADQGIEQGGHIGPQTWPALLRVWLTFSEPG